MKYLILVLHKCLKLRAVCIEFTNYSFTMYIFTRYQFHSLFHAFHFTFQTHTAYEMPGPTTKNNPWADELKKSRRKSSTKGISGKEGGNKEIGRRRSNVDDSGGNDVDDKSIVGNDVLCGGTATTPLNLGETKEMATKPQVSKQQYQKEKANLDEVAKTSTGTTPTTTTVKKCVIATDKVRPPKAKAPSLPVDEDCSRSLYQDARSHLRPVARILSRQLSKDTKEEDLVDAAALADDDDNAGAAVETTVDRLIRQGSLDQQLPSVKSLSKNNADQQGIRNRAMPFLLTS